MSEREQKLYERYFTEEAAQETAVEIEKCTQLIGAIADWLGRPYMAEFRKFLEELRRVNEPQAGEAHNMLYAIGRRDGIDLVLGRLVQLEREVRSNDG
jgi:hypothetical protein